VVFNPNDANFSAKSSFSALQNFHPMREFKRKSNQKKTVVFWCVFAYIFCHGINLAYCTLEQGRAKRENKL